MSDEVHIKLNDGPQTMASRTSATVVCFGGARGGGKSWFSVLEAAKYYDDPDYSAVLFRKTYGELVGAGSLWETSHKIYPLLGAVANKTDLTWVFPSGVTIRFSHLEDFALQKMQGKSATYFAFDEATHFPETAFWFVFSCLRSISRAPRKFILTCNPKKESWLRAMVDWYLDADGFPVPERAGVIRWFGRVEGKRELQWFASEAEALAAGVEPGAATSFTFIPSMLTDNPQLMRADPGYIGRLRSLPPADRLAFLEGNWNAASREPGDLFQRQWCPVLKSSRLERVQFGQPLDSEIRDWLWSVDLASSAVQGDLVPGCPLERIVSGKTADPDWSVFCQWARMRSGIMVLWSCHMYRDGPHQVLWMLRQLIEKGHKPATVVLPQDPGQQGSYQIASYTTALRGAGARVESERPINPVVAAEIASKEVASGRIWMRENALGLDRFWEQAEAFPSKGVHDDAVSAMALGILHDLKSPLPQVGWSHALYREGAGLTVNDVRGGRQTINAIARARDRRRWI